jgi:hypothetical protein
MKDYFSHDYNSRNDPKMVALFMKMGHEGRGIFWDLIEYLYEQGGYLMLSQCECIAYELRTHPDKLRTLISDFGFFKDDGQKFWSESVLKRIEMRNQRSDTARKNAQIRWNSQKNMQSQCERIEKSCKGNAIKETKGNEIKTNNTGEAPGSPSAVFKKSKSEKLIAFTITDAKNKPNNIPLTIWRSVLRECGDDDNAAALVFYRAHRKSNIGIVAWVLAGMKSENPYAIQPIEDEDSNKRKVNDWIEANIFSPLYAEHSERVNSS